MAGRALRPDHGEPLEQACELDLYCCLDFFRPRRFALFRPTVFR